MRAQFLHLACQGGSSPPARQLRHTSLDPFVIFHSLHYLERVTSLSVWLGVTRTPTLLLPGTEEYKNYWHLNT